MSIYAVEYVYAPGTESARDEHRAGHRSFLAGLGDGDSGASLVASGPYTDGSGALLLFSAPSEGLLGEVLTRDPFNARGLVSGLRITEWSPVTGELSHYA